MRFRFVFLLGRKPPLRRKMKDCAMNENLSLTYEGDVLYASLLCEVDHHKAKPLREAIDRAVFTYRPRVLRLDFSAVRFMDSSGVALILGRSALGEDLGFSVVLSGLAPMAEKLLRLSGIDGRKNITMCTGRS